MEIGDSFMQGSGRIISKHPLKITKGYAAVVKIFFTFYGFEAQRLFYKQKHSPEIMVTVLIIAVAMSGLYYIQSFTVRIASLLCNNFSKILCDIYKILHELFRFFENIVVDSL